MSTLIVALLLVGAITGICLLLLSIAKHQKDKKMNHLLNHFSELGTRYQLSFSSQEVLHGSLIGLDGKNRKLLVLTLTEHHHLKNTLIDLNETRDCTVKKYYGHISPGDLKNARLETYLEKLTLHFEFSTGREAEEVVFYHHFNHHVYQLQELEQKATHWKEILTKMLKGQLKKIA